MKESTASLNLPYALQKSRDFWRQEIDFKRYFRPVHNKTKFSELIGLWYSRDHAFPHRDYKNHQIFTTAAGSQSCIPASGTRSRHQWQGSATGNQSINISPFTRMRVPQLHRSSTWKESYHFKHGVKQYHQCLLVQNRLADGCAFFFNHVLYSLTSMDCNSVITFGLHRPPSITSQCERDYYRSIVKVIHGSS